MHSSRMRTARGSSHPRGGVCLSACWDTPRRCRPGNPPMGVGLETPLGVGLETPQDTCKACWDTTCNACLDTTPHVTCEQNSWHTLLKILPCPKLRLRAVIKYIVLCGLFHKIRRLHYFHFISGRKVLLLH